WGVGSVPDPSPRPGRAWAGASPSCLPRCGKEVDGRDRPGHDELIMRSPRNAMRLLVTRPEPDGARTAAALRARGHDVMLAPLLSIEPEVEADLGSGPWDGVLITSASAARAIAAHPRIGELVDLPLFAVGRRSA